MKDEDKTKEQLINELIELRQRNEFIQKTAREISMERVQMEIISNGRIPWSGPYIEGETTDKKRMEKKLEESREKLEETVKKRTEKLRKANERLNREIKKRKLIEEALWESQRRYETLLEILPVGLYQTDSNGRCVYANDLSSKLMGLSQDDLSSCSWMKSLHPDDLAQVTAGLKRCADKRINFNMEFRVLTDGPKVAWVLGQAVPFLGHNDKFMGYLFTFSDITDLKETEEELKDSEERYRKLVELSPWAIAVHIEGRIAFINRLGARLYGLENPDELIGKPLMDFVHPDYRQLVAERVRKIIEEGKSVPLIEEKFILADGTVRDVEVAAVPFVFKNKPAVQVTAQDITERKRFEHDLRLSEERFLKAFNASPDPTAIANFDDGRIVEVNHSFLRVTGFSHEEVIGKTSQELNLLVYPDTFWQAYKKTIDQGFVHNHEIYIRTKTGKKRFGLFSTDIISVDKEKYLIGIFHDLTRRKEAEDALRESGRLMNSIFDSIQDNLSLIDNEFNIVRINSKVKQLFSNGLPLEGKKCHRVFHGNDDICEGCPSLKALKTGRSAHAVLRLPIAGEDKIIWEEHYSYPFIDQKTGEIRGIIVYSRNITDRVKVEKEMARLERLNLIGEMAASIGHEVRNPMTTVRGFLQMLGGKKDWGVYREYFNIMIEELDRANNIITEFLSLARNKPVDLKVTSLNSILRSLSLLMVANGTNSNVDVALELGDIPDVSLNEKEIRQLILNLVRNGLEAMDHGGKLTIKTYLHNGEVVLAVHDQGPGIKADLLDKVGTPFFTTKEEGTGLGLAVCYGIAARHNAIITVETGPSGTEFFVRFKLHN